MGAHPPHPLRHLGQLEQGGQTRFMLPATTGTDRSQPLDQTQLRPRPLGSSLATQAASFLSQVLGVLDNEHGHLSLAGTISGDP